MAVLPQDEWPQGSAPEAKRRSFIWSASLATVGAAALIGVWISIAQSRGPSVTAGQTVALNDGQKPIGSLVTPKIRTVEPPKSSVRPRSPEPRPTLPPQHSVSHPEHVQKPAGAPRPASVPNPSKPIDGIPELTNPGATADVSSNDPLKAHAVISFDSKPDVAFYEIFVKLPTGEQIMVAKVDSAGGKKLVTKSPQTFPTDSEVRWKAVAHLKNGKTQQGPSGSVTIKSGQ